MTGISRIVFDIIISIIGAGSVYLLLHLSEQSQAIKVSVPVVMGICLFFVLTAIQSSSTPEG